MTTEHVFFKYLPIFIVDIDPDDMTPKILVSGFIGWMVALLFYAATGANAKFPEKAF